MKRNLSGIPVALLFLLVLFAGRGVADEVFFEDVIIKPEPGAGEGGHLAIGSQAVSNQVFGSNDKILLKDFTIRIFFDDASDPTGAFPANDWRILINDPTSTGTSFFGVEDATATNIPFRIAAGAPEDSLIVAPSGFLGIGTQSPEQVIHALSGNTPAIRLEQDGTAPGGWPVYAWEMKGNENHFMIKNETADQEPFKIASSAMSDQLVIDGRAVGVNTNTPRAQFHVAVPVGSRGKVIIGQRNNLNTNAMLYVAGSGYFQHDLEVGSSRALKEDIAGLEPPVAQAALEALEPVRFRYKNQPKEKLGFIAEDVPDLVASGDRKSLSPMDFIAVLTSVLKEQQAEIARLHGRLEAVEQTLLDTR